MALTDWHLTPDYINRRWTDELLALMFISRRKRFERQRDLAAGKKQASKLVTDAELFATMGYKPEVVN